MEVIIDGVRYVPVVDAHPDMNAIARGLLKSFYGDVDKNDPDLAQKMESITVRVYDDGQGESIESVLADIASELGK